MVLLLIVLLLIFAFGGIAVHFLWYLAIALLIVLLWQLISGQRI